MTVIYFSNCWTNFKKQITPNIFRNIFNYVYIQNDFFLSSEKTENKNK